MGRVAVELIDSHAQLVDLIRSQVAETGRKPDTLDGAALVSVVPALTSVVAAALTQVTGAPAVVADHRSKLNVSIAYSEPSQVGPDRLMNAVAARVRCPDGAAVVVDVGTAITFDVVDGSGSFRGGLITPGPNIAGDALAQRTARLPKVDLRRPGRVIATDTRGAIQSGLYWGFRALVEGVLDRIAEELGENPRVLATGGLAESLAGSWADEVDPWLTISGLRHIWALNRSVP